jgi:excisionase family DNA binding protein
MTEVLAYTLRQACTVSGIGRTTIYAEIKCGRLKARKIGRRTVILAEDLTDYLRQLPDLRRLPNDD